MCHFDHLLTLTTTKNSQILIETLIKKFHQYIVVHLPTEFSIVNPSVNTNRNILMVYTEGIVMEKE
jgi:hypothetical protein